MGEGRVLGVLLLPRGGEEGALFCVPGEFRGIRAVIRRGFPTAPKCRQALHF